MRWLVLYPCSGGMAQLYNVGVFDADSQTEAIERARKEFQVVRDVHLFAAPVSEVSDGWTYYT